MEFTNNKRQNHFYADITDEDLKVTEKWLIKVSVMDNEDSEEENILVSRKLVYELIQRIEVSNNEASLELCFEVSKLPKIHLTKKQIDLLKTEGKFELEMTGIYWARSIKKEDVNNG